MVRCVRTPQEVRFLPNVLLYGWAGGIPEPPPEEPPKKKRKKLLPKKFTGGKSILKEGDKNV